MNPYYQEMTGLPMTREAMREQADRARDMNYLGMMGKLSGDQGMSAAGGGLVSEGTALRKSLSEASALHPDVKKLIQLGYSPEEAKELAKAQMLADIRKKSLNREGVPSGYEPFINPETGQQGIRPMTGSKDLIQKEEGIRQIYKSLEAVDKMQNLVQEHGSELFGPVAGEMESTYGEILSAIAKARNLGVLQFGELQTLMSQYPNPAKLRALGMSNERILASYENLKEQLANAIKVENDTFSQWGMQTPSNPFAPQQQPQQPGGWGIRRKD